MTSTHIKEYTVSSNLNKEERDNNAISICVKENVGMLRSRIYQIKPEGFDPEAGFNCTGYYYHVLQIRNILLNPNVISIE